MPTMRMFVVWISSDGYSEIVSSSVTILHPYSNSQPSPDQFTNLTLDFKISKA